MNKLLTFGLFFLCLVFVFSAKGQLSPGELSKAHAQLEGLKNCTQCHVLGEKETTSKCLKCHTEIQQLITEKKGYHSSAEVKGKKCAQCHGEHFGRDFKIVHFDEDKFNHELTGYKLEGRHTELKCVDCHKPELIETKTSQKKGSSFLGLGSECLSCHDDFHQNTLSNNCTSCHNQNAFRPATGFNHSQTQFALKGKHQTLDCEACHKITTKSGHEFQQFSGITFSNCTSCHVDVHNNKFGNDCRKCHDESSFTQVKSLSSFNHDKTNFPLRGKHHNLDCKSCHKKSVTQTLKHSLCTDCHTDYHENQFAKNNISPDCSSCHTVNGFSPSEFTIERHNKSDFALDGAHLATPCFSCHKPQEKWNFAQMGTQCVNCHENFHEDKISKKYYPENDCRSCHSTTLWTDIQFNHSKTNFKLEGKHEAVSCRNCHFSEQNENTTQQFANLSASCDQCHNDIHFKQFEVNKRTECEKCHSPLYWQPTKFNHNIARFKLDGEHVGLDCIACHKPTDGLIKNYIVYKFEDISCASCH